MAQLESLVPSAQTAPTPSPFEQLRSSLHSIASEMGRHASVQQELQPVTQAMESLWGMLEQVRKHAAAVEGGPSQCSLPSSALPPLQLASPCPPNRTQQERLLNMLGATEAAARDAVMETQIYPSAPNPDATLGGALGPAAIGGG